MVEIKNISKEYYNAVGIKLTVLKNISISLQPGKITSVLAPKNSGKSTLLKIIADLEKPTSGEISNNTDRKIIYIPTEASSFPWLNVRDNIIYGLENYDEKEIKNIIRLVGLEGYESFQPNNKSLGFRFRISLARSLANNPSAILIDESFNGMDIQTKNEIYAIIRDINKHSKVSFFIATSNTIETIILSDIIYLMKKDPGEIVIKIDTDLPDERGLSLINSEKFIQIKENIFNNLKGIEFQHGISI